MRYFVLVLVLAGCTDLFGPDLTFWGRRPMEPVPEVYATWYAETEECLGRTGNFGAVRWFVADSIMSESGRTIRGATDLVRRHITVRADHLSSEHVVRHEMVHEILQAGNEIHDDRDNVPCEVGFIS